MMPKFKVVGKVIPDKPASRFKKVGTVKKGISEEEIERLVNQRVEKILARQEKAGRWKEKAAEIRAEEDPYKKLAKEQSAAGAFAIGAGKGLFNVARGVGRIFGGDYSKEIEEEKAGYKALQEERPIATTAGEIAGETAPFVPLTGGLSSLATTGRLGTTAAKVAATRTGQMGLAAIAGGTETGISATGRGEELSDIAKETGIGGAAAVAGEALLPPIARKAGRLFKRITGRTPKGDLITKAGEATPELQKALDTAGLTMEDLSKEGVEKLAKMEPYTKPEEAARLAFMEQQGFKEGTAATKAQIERTASAFQSQMEANKVSGIVKARLQNQNALLENKFKDLTKLTGGNPDTTGSVVADHIINKATELDNQISNLYQVAKKVTGDKREIDVKNFWDKIDALKKDDKITGGLVTAIEGAAKEEGITRKIKYNPATGQKIYPKMTASEAENLVKAINRRYKPSDKAQNYVGRQIKNAIDKDVTLAGGPELYKKARSLKRAFHEELERSTLSKFGKKKASLPLDILEEKIVPEEILEKGVLASKYKPIDIKDLKRYLHSGTDSQIENGKKAWNELRAETAEYIRNNAFKGSEDEIGNRTITRARLESVLKKFGKNKEKLKVLFNEQEIKIIEDLHKVTKILEPVPGTAMGKGPTAQAVEAAIKSWERTRKIADKFPGISLLTNLELRKASKTLVGKPSVRKAPTRVSPVAGPVAAATADRLTEEE